jgi:cation transport ATPase
VFGLPVIALQYFGHRLGGAESGRWVAIIQFVMTAWILFIAATGMITEGTMLLVSRRKITSDFVVAIAAALVFLISCVPIWPRMFHIVVIVLAVWSGVRWRSLTRQDTETDSR